MDALFEMIKSIEKRGSVVLPITSIHNIKVVVDIEKIVYTNNRCNCDGDEKRYYFRIIDNHYHNEDNYRYYFNSFDIFTDEFLREKLEWFVRFIKNCEINKLTGQFHIEDDPSNETTNIRNFETLVGLFEDMEHVKTMLNRCCVCHDWTHTTLKDCSHTVCLDCLMKLEEKDCEECHGDDPSHCCDKCEGMEQVRSCPMCREYIINGIE